MGPSHETVSPEDKVGMAEARKLSDSLWEDFREANCRGEAKNHKGFPQLESLGREQTFSGRETSSCSFLS